MKKSILLGIAGLALAGVSASAQGYLYLDNYAQNGYSLVTSGITYGAGVPANGASGAVGSGGLSSAWTVGLYFGTTSVSDPAGSGLPNGALTLATGQGSSATIASSANGTGGAFDAGIGFNTGLAVGTTIYFEVVAFDTAGGSYANAAYRGHGNVFSVVTVAGTAPTPAYTPDAASSFSVAAVPEPTTLALAGLGGFGMLMALRRKQA